RARRQRPVAGHLERHRIRGRVILRDDRVGELAAGGERAGPGGRTFRVDDTVAAIRIEDANRRASERRRREVADSLTRARKRAAQLLNHLIAVAFRRGPEERAVLPDRPSGAAAVEVIEGLREAAAVLGRAPLLGEVFERLSPDRTVLVEGGAM